MNAHVMIQRVPNDPMTQLSWNVSNLTQTQYDLLCEQLWATLEQFRDEHPVTITGAGQNG